MDRREIAIVGGGVAGLVAANQVASDGGRPVLFEAGPILGGRAQTLRVEGYCLNQGPHALYLGGAFHTAMRDFGVSPSGRGPDLPNGLALWGHEAHPFPTRLAQRHPEPLNEAEAAALSVFLRRVRNDLHIGEGVSLATTLVDLPAKARAIIEALVRLSTYVDAPAQIDAKAALSQLRLSFQGTIYVDGGWGRLIDGLERAALGAGAIVRCRAKVGGVHSDGAGWRLSLRDGRSERFPAVIVALPPKNAAAVVSVSAQLAASSAATCPVRLMSLDLALSPLLRQDANFILGIDTPTYLSVHSAAATLAPPSGALMHLARYFGPADPISTDHFEDLRRIADSFHPTWREQLVHEQRLSGATVAYDFPRIDRAGRRTEIGLPDAPGVFLAGDWIGDEGMLADAAAASGRAAARAARAHARDAAS